MSWTKRASACRQTRVYDNKSGVEEPLPGLEPVLWVGWILERAGLPGPAVQLAPSEGEPAEPPAPVAAQEAPASIAAVDLSELWPLPDYPEKRLRAQVRLELSGPQAAEWAADRCSPSHRRSIRSIWRAGRPALSLLPRAGSTPGAARVHQPTRVSNPQTGTLPTMHPLFVASAGRDHGLP